MAAHGADQGLEGGRKGGRARGLEVDRILITRRSRRLYGPFTWIVQKIALTVIVDQADNST